MADKQIISLTDAEHVAKLAHLRFSEDEMADCVQKLGSILEYMQELRTIDTENVPLTTHVLDLQNVFREDVPGPTLTQAQALSNAPQVSEDGKFFRVPRII